MKTHYSPLNMVWSSTWTNAHSPNYNFYMNYKLFFTMQSRLKFFIRTINFFSPKYIFFIRIINLKYTRSHILICKRWCLPTEIFDFLGATKKCLTIPKQMLIHLLKWPHLGLRQMKMTILFKQNCFTIW